MSWTTPIVVPTPAQTEQAMAEGYGYSATLGNMLDNGTAKGKGAKGDSWNALKGKAMSEAGKAAVGLPDSSWIGYCGFGKGNEDLSSPDDPNATSSAAPPQPSSAPATSNPDPWGEAHYDSNGVPMITPMPPRPWQPRGQSPNQSGKAPSKGKSTTGNQKAKGDYMQQQWQQQRHYADWDGYHGHYSGQYGYKGGSKSQGTGNAAYGKAPSSNYGTSSYGGKASNAAAKWGKF